MPNVDMLLETAATIHKFNGRYVYETWLTADVFWNKAADPALAVDQDEALGTAEECGTRGCLAGYAVITQWMMEGKQLTTRDINSVYVAEEGRRILGLTEDQAQIFGNRECWPNGLDANNWAAAVALCEAIAFGDAELTVRWSYDTGDFDDDGVEIEGKVYQWAFPTPEIEAPYLDYVQDLESGDAKPQAVTGERIVKQEEADA